MADQGRHQTDPRGPFQDKGTRPSATKVLALFPMGAGILLVSGLTFVATIIALAIATPLFVIFSPVLVPAALAIALAVAGFLASGAFGIAALSALLWIGSCLWLQMLLPEKMGHEFSPFSE